MNGAVPAPVGLLAGRMTRAGRDALFWRIGEILRSHRPQTVRQIFYQCLDPAQIAHVAKSGAGYGRVQRAVLDMRRRGLVAWPHIVDGTRQTVYHSNGYEGLGDFLEAYRDAVKFHLWERQAERVEVWCESRGFAASVDDVADRWRVDVTAFAGQPSDTLLFDCAQRINQHAQGGQPTTVLYCGDLDLHGAMIEEVPRRKLKAQFAADPSWMRVLVTEEQVVQYALPSDESGSAVQAEALPIQTARGLIEQAIATFIPYEEIEKAEQAEHERSGRLLASAWDLDDEFDRF